MKIRRVKFINIVTGRSTIQEVTPAFHAEVMSRANQRNAVLEAEILLERDL
jgi:hypothetical protein